MQLFTAELNCMFTYTFMVNHDIIVLLKCDSILQKGDKLKENVSWFKL